MGYSNTNIYIIAGIVIIGLVWGVFEWRKSRKTVKKVPAITPIVKEEVKEMPDVVINSSDYLAPSKEEPTIDLSKIESVDSDKPFANLKANSVGPAPAKKVTKKKAAKKTTAKKIVALDSSTALGAPKKRTKRKKDNNV